MTHANTQTPHLGAVHDGVTAVQLVCIIQLSQALLREVISAVNDPSAVAAVPYSVHR